MKRLLLLVLAVVILALIYSRIGWGVLAAAVAGLEAWWLAAAFACFLPQILIQGWRFRLLAAAHTPLGFGRATGLCLLGQSLNVVLPAKLGDVAKGVLVAPERADGARLGLALGLFEKATDTACLALLMLLATALRPPDEWLGLLVALAAGGGLVAYGLLLLPAVNRRFATTDGGAGGGIAGKVRRLLGTVGGVLAAESARPGRFLLLFSVSLLLWLAHLAQFSCLVRAASPVVDDALLWSRIPMAIFVGLAPITFAGIGTRDAALVHLLGGVLGGGVAAVIGLFATVRYVVPAILGLPFLLAAGDDVQRVVEQARGGGGDA